MTTRNRHPRPISGWSKRIKKQILGSLIQKMQKSLREWEFDGGDEFASKDEFWVAFYGSLDEKEISFLLDYPCYVRQALFECRIKPSMTLDIAREFIMQGPSGKRVIKGPAQKIPF
jgi:hypothetical protein